VIKNYFKMLLRNIKKQPGFSLINISGLAIGMACCILILLFIQDELSYDNYHQNVNQIYRLAIDSEIGGSIDHYAIPPFAAAPAFTRELPEIRSFTRLLDYDGLVSYATKQFEEEGIFCADTTFFEIFSHEFIRGDAGTVLDQPGAVVITEETAAKIFGEENPVGKSFKINRFDNLHVAGIIKNVPRNSHFRFNYIISMATFKGERRNFLNRWLNITGWSYLLLEPEADAQELHKKFAAIVEKHTGERAKAAGIKLEFFLQKLADIHLHSNLQAEIAPNSDIKYVYTFGAVALFILIIACINFMNLSTARSALRAREVGIRKVAGADRQNIIFQFLSESTLFAITALVISLLIVLLTLPLFNRLAAKQLEFSGLTNSVVILALCGLSLFVGLFAGSYPAFYLSSFQPVYVLRGILGGIAANSAFRKILVVLQFSISVILITCTLIVIDQVNFMKNKRLGFDKEQIMVLLMRTNNPPTRFETIKYELLQHPNVVKAAYSSVVPGQGGEVRLFIPEGNDSTETHVMNLFRVDYEFITTFGMEIAQGRDFSFELPTDSTEAFLINETAARKLGWPEEAVGKKFEFARVQKGKIVGVVKDFHFRSLTEEISPVVFMIARNPGFFLSLKINSVDVAETIDFIEKKWRDFEPARPIDYFFMDEDFVARYSAEEKVGDIIGIFALLAIFIAALGLFGLASFMVDQRTKEIGIRKVLGASISNLLGLLSKEFALLILIANIISWPIAFYLIYNFWLTNFPYQINPIWMSFLTSGLIAGAISVLLTLFSVSYQAIKAALANPIKSLRYE